MNKTLTILIMPLLLALDVSCGDSLSGSSLLCQPSIVIEFPADLPDGEISGECLRFKNVSSGTTLEYGINAGKLLPGLYDISYEAKLSASNGRVFSLRAFLQSCVITDDGVEIKLNAQCLLENNDLIISEIFFAGTLLPSGNSYTGDDYVKLCNNTDHVVYADGIVLFESKFLTTEKNEYSPDIMAQAMTVHALYVIPGNGKEHPIEPGDYLLIADNGIDHRQANPYSFDLSHADFEWYDQSSSPTNLDIDNPDVPNMDKWYCYTKSYWMLHNRGFKAYGIARVPIDRDEYLKDYYYSYEYTIVTAAGSFPMTGQAYRMPNEWIVDAVNCSVASDYAWNVSSPALDSGWASCGAISADKNRSFKSVRRRLLYIDEGGRPVLKDTNNSTDDFNSSAIPSEIELQGSVMDMDGRKCDAITYDGITPIEK